ncbi:aldo/keto reductase [Roseomonas sp. 18066]|uniref:aldo/keto reductase n=1 Tax=Roseomonas sp. 18066 TaxID=2681412 RepID=UPI0013569FD6|nr:aldo/keto reductase [Roseomonas sp. 18066]
MALDVRNFGPEGWPVARFGMGCGGVGGLMVRGAPADQDRVIGRALEAGITYFDTAVQYGNGASEENLGRVLRALKPRQALVGTKVRIPSAEFGDIAGWITRSLEGSLARLQRDQVDIFYLHNEIGLAGGGETLSVRQVLEEVVPAFQALQAAGKFRLPAITALGETAALQQVLDTGFFGAAQVVYNLLNPSAGADVPAGFPAQNYEKLLLRCQAARIGTVGIRVLAGGALSGTTTRHPVASAAPPPLGSGRSFAEDIARAADLAPLVTEGFAASLPEAAIRFALTPPGPDVLLVGTASPEEFDGALAAIARGPLPPEALALVQKIEAAF